MLNLSPAPLPEFDYYELNRERDRVNSEIFMRPDAAFFGSLLCGLNFEWQPGLDTAATDAVTMWWDPVDFVRLPRKGRVSTTMHELWHVARMHAVRRGDRCPDTWNKACDIWINNQLIADGYELVPPELWLVVPQLAHMQVEEEIYELLKKQGKPQPQPGGLPGGTGKCKHGQIPVTNQVKQQTITAVSQAVNAAKLIGKPGAIPGNTERWIKQFLKPIIPWEVHLQRFFNDLLDEDFTWSLPDRRHLANGLYLPSEYLDEGRLEHIMVFEDVSGSITKPDSVRFNSELKYMWETFNPQKLTIVQFDTEIKSIIELNEGDVFDEIRLLGFGGTCLKCVRQLIMDKRPNAAIVFSDLDVAPMLPGPECPILWVAIGNKNAQVNFGQLIHIKG